MRRKHALAGAATAALALVLSACGGGGGTSQQPAQTAAGGGAQPAFNAALTQVYNPSTKKGGTLKAAHSADWDSLDPGDTYYGYSFNFGRFYWRTLTMYKPGPGPEGNTVIPDLAEGLGTPSDDGKTWTYKLKSGLKYEDGTPITAKDVAYAVARSYDKETFPHGPSYLNELLDWPKDFKGVYKSADVDYKSAVEATDDSTVVFHLKKPFASMDYIVQMPMSAPVPKDKDTGAKYKEKVLSSGPYKFETNEIGKRFTLVRNDQWDPATDPNRPALPDRIEVQLNVNADDLDNQLISGDIDLDIPGTGLQPAALGKVLPDPALKARTDNPTIPRLWYVSVIPDNPPMDNVECRKAVMWAADRVANQTAYGGPLAGGDIATNVMPPPIVGQEKFDLYTTPENKGDVAKAKEALTACGQPNGFSTTMAFRSDRPREKALAEAMQQALAKVNIKVELKGFPGSSYFSDYAGNTDYVKKNGIGLAGHGWGSDWPDGYGFMQAIVDSRTIRKAGNYNLSVKNPEVDKLIDQASSELDETARAKLWVDVDKKVMEDASILPVVWAKSLLMRGTRVTNVAYNEGQSMYDYILLGVE
ncbi:ABC transporter substrate-binding protein [Nonomuraea fuscirosea]|uniref:Peptide/nickel transport system substrate-binding protein n=1 Tax=Nonomuraea fuscirosea TaxID=1291556 RepID=A0A2T0MEF7_9ACTN|nr:ABC transporter substrate-binding protein [Nonomuraea fuscirosea]PRX55934.1 peptide/nickel transport system substrate-binding protein [Nonomuraea fuscirosea]WSA55513.1 ABC transporter substrate-binding protein [Nonomuraea fuscirosea]